ncbi:MAG: hypothetical protein GW900_02715 [Gammaproteobacteria bacterium]|nr:hypothetical protein [Gammaproteobacteria bacterium]
MITVAFAVVPVFIVVGLIHSHAATSGALDQQQLVGRLLELEWDLSALKQQGRNYLDHAPRDYDDYFRDVEIVYPNLMTHVNSLDNRFAMLTLQAAEIPGSELAGLVTGWDEFHGGLQEQLGVDPQMPRLEWAARHITERLPALIEQTSNQRRALDGQAAAGIDGLAMLLALITALAMSVWSLRTTVWRD